MENIDNNISEQVLKVKKRIETEELSIKELKNYFNTFFFDVLGLKSSENVGMKDVSQLEGTVKLLLEIRDQARASKDFETSDLIRKALSELNIQINDAPEGSNFKIN